LLIVNPEAQHIRRVPTESPMRDLGARTASQG
jgi:hypothetical protein